MKFKFKTFAFIISLVFNCFFIFLIVLSSFSKNSFLSFPSLGDNFVTAAAVASVPSYGSAAFGTLEIILKQGEKASLQFSVFINRKQSNLLLTALYDHGIISVSQTGYGIVITALSEGSTLMQTISNDGIKDIAFVTVVK